MPYIGRGPGFGVRSRFIYTATAGQTSFSGNDDAGISLAYTDTLYIDVYQNGVLLVPATDYASTTGTSVVLVQGASVGDTVEMVVYDIFSVADAVSAKDGGTFSGTIAAAGLSTSSLGTSNFRAGVNAGNSITAGGNFNVTVGDEAGTAITTGDNNTALGYGSLDATTTANNNTALGFNAGTAVTTGTENVFVGGKSGDALTDADYNTVLGYEALTADTLGSKSTAIGTQTLMSQNFDSAQDTHNTAVGYQAGVAVTTGTENTLIGSLSGDAITTGVKNTALGYKAVSSVTTGDFNTGVGRTALENVTTADGNTAVGVAAGAQTTTGANNTAMGYLALNVNTTGHSNVAVGYKAVTACVDGEGNTAVGFEALLTEDSGSKSTAIGYRALKVQDNAASNHNTAVGYDCLSSDTTGINNTGIGKSALNSLTTGDNNVGVGVESGAQGAMINIIGEDNRAVFGNNTTTHSYVKVDWTVTSDQRDKTDITNFTHGLDYANKLRPVNYVWDERSNYEDGIPDGSKKKSEVQLGFLAQEVQAIETGLGIDNNAIVDTEFSDSLKMTNAKLIPVLVNAIKELSEKNDALESRLAALEAK